MANKKKPEEKDVDVVIESAIGRTEAWLQHNAKTLLTILGVIVVVVGGYFAYKNLYQDKRQERAAAAIYQAQQAFLNEDYALALNGDGNTIGFLSIADQYGGTSSGNLAKHYAGQCYLRLGDYQNAIKYFGMYKDVKGIPSQIVNSMNAGLTGDEALSRIERMDALGHVLLRVYADPPPDNPNMDWLSRPGTTFFTKGDQALYDVRVGQISIFCVEPGRQPQLLLNMVEPGSAPRRQRLKADRFVLQTSARPRRWNFEGQLDSGVIREGEAFDFVD